MAERLDSNPDCPADVHREEPAINGQVFGSPQPMAEIRIKFLSSGFRVAQLLWAFWE